MNKLVGFLAGAIFLATPFAASAVPLASQGVQVGGYFSSTPVGTIGSNGYYSFDIPLNGTTDMFFKFNLGSADLSQADILFEFLDLDLNGANTPSYLTEQVQFFTKDGALSNVVNDINYFGSNEGIGHALVAAAGNSTSQMIGIGGLEDLFNSLGVNDIIVRASFSNFSSQNGSGAPEYVKASLYTQEVPEPASMLLLGSGLVGLSRMRKRKLTEA